jgi:2-hydroxy-3-oxopropionate reductase
MATDELSTTPPARVGLIGIGVMGAPMAITLIDAGYAVTVFTRTTERAQRVLDRGAAWADAPAVVAQLCDVVITALPSEESVRMAVTGGEGLLDGAHQGLVWIDTSTISPRGAQDLARQAEEVGVRSLDAPVSGGETGAWERTLAIMVGGPEEVYQRCLPILRCLGKSVVYMGPSGAGQVTKACNQMVVGVTIATVSEALSLGGKAGIDPARIRQVLLGGYGSSRVLELHGQRMLEGSFAPGGRIEIHRKDLDIALELARELEAVAPLTAVVLQLMHAAAAAGDNDLDHSALVRVYERLNNKQLVGDAE